MEREGEGRGREGREGRGEMRKGIIVGGMVLGLLMGCNNGMAELEKRNQFLSSLANLGNEFLNVFTSFGDMISGETLGFNTESKKSDVAAYFKRVHDTVEGTKTALNKIVDNMKAENNPHAVGVETAVKTLVTEKLEKIIEGARIASDAIGNAGEQPVANVADGSPSNVAGIKGKSEDLVKGIKNIVDVVLKDKGDADAGDSNSPVQDGGTAGDARSSSGATHGDSRKLFANDNAGAPTDAAKAAKDAAKAVGAVTGADILQAMVKKDGDAAKLANSDVGVSGVIKVATNAKDATIAGGIALRAMAKDGKFAGPTGGSAKAEIADSVKGAAVSAVTKALDTLAIAIRKTIDEELKKVQEAMKINANDTPATTESKS